MSCTIKARRLARMLEILRESWLEFANSPQRPAVAGFSETGRVPLNRGLGTVKQGEQRYGRMPWVARFPFALSVLVQSPTHGSKLGQRLGAERKPFMREGAAAKRWEPRWGPRFWIVARFRTNRSSELTDGGHRLMHRQKGFKQFYI